MAQQTAIIQNLQVGQIVFSLWSYKSQNIVMTTGDRDISINKGEEMKIIKLCPNQWLKVEVLASQITKPGTQGVLPAAYVRIQEYVETLTDYSALGVIIEGLADISVQNQERLKFLKYSTQPGWIRVQRLNSDTVGVIPLAFVKKIKQPGDVLFRENQTTAAVVRPVKKPFSYFAGKTQTLPRNINPLPAILTALKTNPEELTEADFGMGDPDSSLNLLMSENAHGEAELRAATLEKLIEKLTTCSGVPARLPHDVLLTYQIYSNSTQVLTLLEKRFFPATKIVQSLQGEEQAIFERKFLGPIRLRVLNTLKIWIEEHWRTSFGHNVEFMDKVSTLLKKIKSIDKYESMTIRMLSTINERMNAYLPLEQLQVRTITPQDPPPPSRPIDQKLFESLPPHLQWKALPAEEVARQISLIDYDLMFQIEELDLLTHVKTKQKDRNPDSNVLKSIHRFNRTSMMVPSIICILEKRSHRVEAISWFVDICEYLYKWNNFTSLTALVAGLTCGNMRRMKNTWERVPNAKKKLLSEVQELLTPEGNYLNLRTHLHSGIQKPALPYLGQFLADLTFINDGNPVTVDSPDDQSIKLINFAKCRLISSVLGEFRQYFPENLQLRYNFKPVPAIVTWMESIDHYDDNTCYQLSLYVEPKEGKQRNSIKPKDKKSLSPGIMGILNSQENKPLPRSYTIVTPPQINPDNSSSSSSFLYQKTQE